MLAMASPKKQPPEQSNVFFPGDARGMNPSEMTITEVLKEAGYVTGCLGKWHLGDQLECLPNAQGFDEYEGIPYSLNHDVVIEGNDTLKIDWIVIHEVGSVWKQILYTRNAVTIIQ
jgi:arylsulfatase A